LLQLMDDGVSPTVRDAPSTSPTRVIMTSNLGAGGSEDQVMNAVRDHFKPEFLNRIDEIVVFHRLSEEDIARIVDLQVEHLRGRLAERGSRSSSPTRHARGSRRLVTTPTTARGR
jgi:ATP-dependent Clp protease ATP-binding subunit ClpB